MVVSLRERTTIAVLISFGMLGLFVVIISFSVMVAEIINNGNFKSLVLFIPIAMGLFIFFLAFNYLNQSEFVLGEDRE